MKRGNRAQIVVNMSGGERLEWTTKPDGPLATDTKKFAEWLIETGNTILSALKAESQP